MERDDRLAQQRAARQAAEETTARERVARQAAEAVQAEAEAARAEAEAARAHLQAMQYVTDAALTHLGLDELLRELLGRITAVLQADNAAILLLDEASEQLVVHLARGPEEVVAGQMRVPVGQGVAGRIAASRQPLLVEDVRALEPVNPILREQVASLLGVPLLVADRLIGVMHVDSATPRRFTQEELRLVERVADRVALAIDNARLHAAERAARAQAEAAVRLRDHILSLATHDVRAPLTTVMGRAQWVERRLQQGQGVDQTWLAQQLRAIRDAAQRIEALVGDLADVAHLQMGQELALTLEEVDLVALVRQVVSEEQTPVGTALIAVEAPAAVRVRGDRQRLRRVLQNVLGNAVKYSPYGRPIQVVVTEQGPWAVVTVQDQGVGIPADELPQVFTPFFRAATAQGMAGTGLGLWGAQAIVAQHGGEIDLASTVGVGTTVTLRLPRASA
jgi:signal transduction histidine kinase